MHIVKLAPISLRHLDFNFYNPNGRTSEPLFAALMKQLQAYPINKDAGLRELQQNGRVLIDATYESVNKPASHGRD